MRTLKQIWNYHTIEVDEQSYIKVNGQRVPCKRTTRFYPYRAILIVSAIGILFLILSIFS